MTWLLALGSLWLLCALFLAVMLWWAWKEDDK